MDFICTVISVQISLAFLYHDLKNMLTNDNSRNVTDNQICKYISFYLPLFEKKKMFIGKAMAVYKF